LYKLHFLVIYCEFSQARRKNSQKLAKEKQLFSCRLRISLPGLRKTKTLWWVNTLMTAAVFTGK
jgi:hypothetical protein